MQKQSLTSFPFFVKFFAAKICRNFRNSYMNLSEVSVFYRIYRDLKFILQTLDGENMGGRLVAWKKITPTRIVFLK